jgi:hypothetical protein
VNVFIARGSVDIGRFPQEQLPELARQGVIKRTDTYWHKGMDGWEPISDLLRPAVWEPGSETPVLGPIAERAEQSREPATGGSSADQTQQSRETPPPRALGWGKVAIFCLGALVALAALGYMLIKPDAEPIEPGATRLMGGPASAVSPATTANREKAAADLQQRIARLPQQPSAPLNTYYYDISTELEETFATQSSWRAVIRGRENVLKPESEETRSQTEFTVTAEYVDGEWVYKSYRATTLNTEDQTTNTVQHDAMRIAPPVLVGILGLKTADYSPVRR